jgi:hypothetical protein
VKRKQKSSAILKARALRILRQAKHIHVVEWGFDLEHHQLRIVFDGFQTAANHLADGGGPPADDDRHGSIVMHHE